MKTVDISEAAREPPTRAATMQRRPPVVAATTREQRQKKHHQQATTTATTTTLSSIKSSARGSRITLAILLAGLMAAAPSQQTTALTAVDQNHTCNYPGSPAHASVTFNTSQIVAGTAASYTCDNGYELLGPPRRFCQANGTWAPVGIPFCGKCVTFFSLLSSRFLCLMIDLLLDVRGTSRKW